MKLVRPGFGPPAEPAAVSQARRRHGGCRSRIASSGMLAATAAPLRLRHASPGRTAYREIRSADIRKYQEREWPEARPRRRFALAR